MTKIVNNPSWAWMRKHQPFIICHRKQISLLVHQAQDHKIIGRALVSKRLIQPLLHTQQTIVDPNVFSWWLRSSASSGFASSRRKCLRLTTGSSIPLASH
jgi:hypothetical protein